MAGVSPPLMYRTARLNRIDDGTMVVPSGFFDAVIVKR